jgi:hypothetical protein
MAEHVVKVWNRPHTVTVHQKSKSVWVAVGDYMDETIRTEDGAETSALRRWKEAATYKGN